MFIFRVLRYPTNNWSISSRYIFQARESKDRAMVRKRVYIHTEVLFFFSVAVLSIGRCTQVGKVESKKVVSLAY